MGRKKAPSFMAHMLSIILLTFNVTIVIPLLLIYFFSFNLAWGFMVPYNILTIIIGVLCIIFGLVIVTSTIFQFARKGKETLVSWNSPQRLFPRRKPWNREVE